MNDLMNRRDLLKLAGMGVAVFVSGTTVRAGGAAQIKNESFYFVQLSDTHWGFNGPNINPDSQGTLKKAVAAVNGLVKIPAAGLDDHKLHIFSVQSPDGEVRLVAILDDTDTVRAALDACSICGAQGYYQDGRNVICRNCGAAIVTRSIGVSGGCNPNPVHFVIENNLLTISENELIPATRIFKP